MRLTLTQELGATAEICGTVLSEMAAQLLAEEVSRYPEAYVRGALARCRRDLKGRMTLAEIVSRLDDGRPGPDEAWAMLPWREDQTAVLTDEMMQAQGAVRGAYEEGDRVGARFAFRETYVRLVNEARETCKPVDWQVSLGWDKTGREGPIKESVAKCRLTPSEARQFIPLELPGETPILLNSAERMPVTIAELVGTMTMPKRITR